MIIKPTIYIAIGIIIGIAFTRLFTSNSPCPQITAITKPTALKEQTTKTEIKYQKEVDSLKVIAKDLDNKLTNNNANLALAKNKTLVLQSQLFAAREKDIVPSSYDTEKISCPSADNLFTEFIETSAYKDSLYEAIDSTRQQQLQNKDAVLAVKDSMYNDLKASFDYSISQQELLFTQNKLLRRQVNRQKLKGKLVSAAVLIVSVSAANYLLKH